jgi:ABC-type multidrug transport system fused ATPase/permease subunit
MNTRECMYRTARSLVKPSLIVILTVLAIVVAICQIVSVFLLQQLKSNMNRSFFIKFTAAIVISQTLKYVYYQNINNIMLNNSKELMKDSVERWFLLDAYQQNDNAATFAGALSGSLASMKQLIAIIFKDTLINGIIFLAFFGGLMYICFSWFLVFWFVCNFALMVYILPKVNKIYKDYAGASKKYNQTMYDIILNSWNVKFDVMESEVKEEITALFNSQTKHEKALQDSILFYQRFVGNVIFGALVVFLVYTFLKTDIGEKNPTIFWLIVFQIYSKYFEVWFGVFQVAQVVNNASAVCKFWAITPTIQEYNAGKALDKIERIEFRNVAFRYGNNTSVFTDANLDIKAGETVALVGASGSGKSTATNLLFRLVETTEGEILVNGVDVRNYSLCSLRRKFGVVPQNIRLFEKKTVRENIVLFREERAVSDVLAAVHLDNVDPETKASDLSLGQKQRVMLARVLYGFDEVGAVLFDEYLSAVNPEMSNAIHKNVLELIHRHQKIGIFISHNHETAHRCDRVMELQNGKFIQAQ